MQESGNKPTANLNPLYALPIRLLTQVGIMLGEVRVTILYG